MYFPYIWKNIVIILCLHNQKNLCIFHVFDVLQLIL